MTSANIQRLISVAAPLWAGEAEVVRTYWTSPARSLPTDLLWLQRQCFKEFWGSGVGKYDRGGVFLGQLRNLADKALEIDISIDRHEILDVVEGLKAEFSHYCHFADLYDSRLMEKLIAEQLRHRIRMHNAQFSRPLPEERVQAIFRGEIPPIEFDYRRARLAA